VAPVGPSKDRAPSSPANFPQFDASLVGAVAARVQIAAIELVKAQFTRVDDDHFQGAVGERKPDRYGLEVSWQANENQRLLSCLIEFGTIFDAPPEPFEIRASFRLLYEIQPGDPLTDAQLGNFTYWNALFNAWPYWREYLSSTLNRAHLPRFVVPVMGVPRASG